MYLLSSVERAGNCSPYSKSNDVNLLDVLKSQKNIGGNACLLIGESRISHENFISSLPENIEFIYVLDINKKHLNHLERTMGNQIGKCCLYYVHIDIFSFQECASLSQIISENGHLLGLLNLTNVHQYDYNGRLISNIEMLPLANRRALIYSRTGGYYFSKSSFQCTSFSTMSLKALRFFLSIDSCLTKTQLDGICLDFLQPLRNIVDLIEKEQEIVQSICTALGRCRSVFLNKFIYIALFLSGYIDEKIFRYKANQLFKLNIPILNIEERSREKLVAQYLLADCLALIETNYLNKERRIARYRKETILNFKQEIAKVDSLLDAHKLLYQLKEDNFRQHNQHSSYLRFWKGLTQSRLCILLDKLTQENIFHYSLLAPQVIEKKSGCVESFNASLSL